MQKILQKEWRARTLSGSAISNRVAIRALFRSPDPLVNGSFTVIRLLVMRVSACWPPGGPSPSAPRGSPRRSAVIPIFSSFSTAAAAIARPPWIHGDVGLIFKTVPTSCLQRSLPSPELYSSLSFSRCAASGKYAWRQEVLWPARHKPQLGHQLYCRIGLPVSLLLSTDA